MRPWERLIYVVSLVAVVVAGVAYVNYVQRESDRRWCSIMGTLSGTYNDPSNPPPTTPIGKQLAKDFRVLHADLPCEQSTSR